MNYYIKGIEYINGNSIYNTLKIHINDITIEFDFYFKKDSIEIIHKELFEENYNIVNYNQFKLYLRVFTKPFKRIRSIL